MVVAARGPAPAGDGHLRYRRRHRRRRAVAGDRTAAVVPAGATPPQYGRFLPAGWRDHQRTRQAVHDRMGALERAGARLFVERLRLEWRPGTPVAGHSGRLTFRPVRDPGELVELLTLLLDGPLDAHRRADLT